MLSRANVSGRSFLTESVCEFVVQKSIRARIRQLTLYYYKYKE